MVAGNWTNADGLFLQYGTQKAIPEIAGDFLAYGNNREIEVYLNLAANPAQINSLPGLLQTTSLSFAAGGSAASAGVISGTLQFPLQTQTVTSPGTGSAPNVTQIFIEQVEVVTLVGMATSAATGINLGLVATQTAATYGSPSNWAQVTPNAGVQLLNALPNAAFTTAGQKIILTGLAADNIPANQTGAGSWMGVMPVTTLAAGLAAGSPLVQSAYLSAAAVNGTYTAGLLKIRIKYCTYGQINQ